MAEASGTRASERAGNRVPRVIIIIGGFLQCREASISQGSTVFAKQLNIEEEHLSKNELFSFHLTSNMNHYYS